ncbi:MAG: amidohydrolase family protein [Acidobacteriota bacterium]
MIIDCHYHLDEQMMPMSHLLAEMDRNNIAKTALIARVCEPFYSPADFITTLKANVGRACLRNVPPLGAAIYRSLMDNQGTFLPHGQPISIIQEPDNKPVVDAVARNPERFIGWIAVNPNLQTEAMQVIEDLSVLPGMIGVKVHWFFHRFAHDMLDQVAGYCQERSLPMLVHLPPDPDACFYLPHKFPQLKVIYAHAGVPWFKKVWGLAHSLPNVFIDLSSDYLDAKSLRMAVEYVGHRKCLFGTDGPFGLPQPGDIYDYSRMKGWIENLSIGQSETDAILCSNFLSLISL